MPLDGDCGPSLNMLKVLMKYLTQETDTLHDGLVICNVLVKCSACSPYRSMSRVKLVSR
jgi:hypothetical protein